MLHPRFSTTLVGHHKPFQRLYDLYQQGVLAPCWVVNGQRGIGKATFAYQFVQKILVTSCPNPSGLSETVVSQQVKVGSYPNLCVAEKPMTEGQEGAEIPLSEAKKILNFLAQSPAIPGWRAVIIDAADELNRSAANCLLKIIEEPPPQTLILLISHSWGQVLPTLRSRCQRLDLYPLTGTDMAEFYGPQHFRDENLFKASQGSLRYYQDLIKAGGQEFLSSLQAMINLARLGQWVQVQKFCQDISKLPERFECVLWLMPYLVYQQALQGQTHEQKHWLSVWQSLTKFLQAAKDSHLDKNQVLLSCFLLIENPSEHATTFAKL